MTESNRLNALGQLSVGGLDDWQRAGLSINRVRALVQAGQLVRLRRGAYATSRILADAQADPGLRHALDVAAVRVTRDRDLVASHQSAATMRGLKLLTALPVGAVTVTAPPGTRNGGYARSGVTCHVAELPEKHMTHFYGVPATSPARTVIDIARTSSFVEGVVVADSALYERYASRAELKRVLAACPRWPGIARAAAVVDFADRLAESVLESCARVAFSEHGLPPPELQVTIFGRKQTMIARVDFLWRQHGVIVEADGLLKYDSGQAAIRQLERDRLLRDLGYEVVHFTWKELFSAPDEVARRIREALRRQARYHPR